MSAIENARRVGVDLLRPEHVQPLQALAADPALSETVRLAYPLLFEPAAQFVARAAQARAEGEAYVKVITDRSSVMGLCGLHEVNPWRSGKLRFWVGRPFQGTGVATFATGNMLDFAFGPLRLGRVTCRVKEDASAARRVLEKHGFVVPTSGSEAGAVPGSGCELLEVTREGYLRRKHEPFLRDLSSELKPILEAELAVGNEIGECTRGWPEKDSIIIALRRPFRPPAGPLPPNVEYREVNDTHWWKAEYALKKPVHLLTCGF